MNRFTALKKNSKKVQVPFKKKFFLFNILFVLLRINQISVVSEIIKNIQPNIYILWMCFKRS